MLWICSLFDYPGCDESAIFCVVADDDDDEANSLDLDLVVVVGCCCCCCDGVGGVVAVVVPFQRSCQGGRMTSTPPANFFCKLLLYDLKNIATMVITF